MTAKTNSWPGIAAIYEAYLNTKTPAPVLFPYPVKKSRKVYSLLLSLMLLSTVFSYSAFAVEEDFVYDANGNLVRDGRFYYEYDGGNMLSVVREGNMTGRVVEEYWYDAGGERVKKVHYLLSGGNETTYYVSGGFDVEVDENGTSHSTNYVFVNGERVAALYQNGSRIYFLDDYLGSSSVLVDGNGILQDRVQYQPFGAIKAGGSASKYGYNNKELDDTGLNYYGARYYSSRILRWTQPDTVNPSVYNPQLLNVYSYASNNPTKFIDPSGHEVTYSKNTVGEVSVYADDAFFGTVVDGYRYEPQYNSGGGVFYDYSIRTSSTYGAPNEWSSYTLDTGTYYSQSSSYAGSSIFNVNTRIVMMSDLINYNNKDFNRKEAWDIYQLGSEAILSVGGLQYFIKGKKASTLLKAVNSMDNLAGGQGTTSAISRGDSGSTLWEASGFIPVWGAVKSGIDLSTYKGSGLSSGQKIPDFNKQYIIGYYYSPNSKYSSMDLSYRRDYGNSNSWYLGGTRTKG